MVLAAWSWGRWTDVHIDFGNELYLAWRLAEGDVLYRDLAHRNGPLSPYLNALWFTLFGVSIRTLVWVNLAILAGIVAMTWRLLRDAAGRGAATAACAVLLAVFGFSQYTTIANYNYVTPYHHQQTHGIALSIAMLLALARGLRAGRAIPYGVAGLCFGAVLLTKAELAVPAALAAGVGLGMAARERPPGRCAAAFATGVLVPVAGFAVLLAAQMPLAQAAEGLLGNFAYLGTGVLRDPFYAAVTGADHPAHNALRMLGAFALVAGFAALAAGVDRVATPRLRSPAWSALAAAALCVALLGLTRAPRWLELARALPLTSAVGVALLWTAWLRSDSGERERLAPLLLWAVWSLALLGKIALRARFGHYGFALAMPATLLWVVLLVGWIPARLRAAYGGGGLARALALGALGAGVVSCLYVSQTVYADRTVRVGSGPDAILAAGPRAARVERALERLDALATAQATLLVLPEGVGINYWLRMRNPARFNLFLPTEIAAFGEDVMLAALRAEPPDWVALVHRGHREFGVGPFGRDPRYGRALLDWVRAEYERVERIGPEPFGDEGFGIVLLRRRGAASAPRALPSTSQ